MLTGSRGAITCNNNQCAVGISCRSYKIEKKKKGRKEGRGGGERVRSPETSRGQKIGLHSTLYLRYEGRKEQTGNKEESEGKEKNDFSEIHPLVRSISVGKINAEERIQ